MKKIGFKAASSIMVLALISIISVGFLANSMTTITTSSQNVNDVVNSLSEQLHVFRDKDIIKRRDTFHGSKRMYCKR